ncbi:MAG: MerR family transcriptional regulator [Actinomycetota bacterium]
MDDGSIRFSIGEAARAVGIAPQTVRAWEVIGLIHPLRSERGTRYYRKEDIEKLKQIKQLRTIQGLNFAAIKKELGTAQAPTGGAESDFSAPQRRIGERLRQVRIQSRKTLKEVAELTNLSVSFLSSLEHGYTGASVASLRSIAEAYGVSVRDLFGTEPEPSSPHVTPSERPVIHWPNGARYEELAPKGLILEPTFVYVPRNVDSGGFYSHAGEEFLYVLSGVFFLELMEQKTYRLEAQHSLCFISTTPHRWWTEDEEAELIWVDTPNYLGR